MVARSTALRREGFSPAQTAAILTQAALRRRAGAKFGEFADRMLFTRAGLEQATRLDVAARHAARFRARGAEVVADLGCGIGGDALAIAAVGLACGPSSATRSRRSWRSTTWPRSRRRRWSSRTRRPPISRASTPCGSIRRRRTAGHADTRRVGVAGYSPSLDFVDRTAARLPTGVKLSPAHDRATIADDAEAQWVSDRGDVVELVVWRGGMQREGVRRAALVSGPAGTAELTAPGDTADEPVGALGDHVYEPDGAVIRARLLGDLARSSGTHPVGPGIAYLSGDGFAASPFLTSFAVDACSPSTRSGSGRSCGPAASAASRSRSAGSTSTRRRSGRASALRGDEEAVLIVTRTADRRVALICHR